MLSHIQDGLLYMFDFNWKHPKSIFKINSF